MNTLIKEYDLSSLPIPTNYQKLYKQLESLVLNYNQDLKHEVIRAKDKYNLKIRSVIADKTGLSLVFRNRDFKNEPNFKEKGSVPIQIEDKVPVSLLEILEKHDLKLIQLLLHYRAIISSLHELEYQISNYNVYKGYHKEKVDKETLKASIKHLKLLSQEIETSGILREIKQLGPDIFGRYFGLDTHIELYWLSIGLCSLLYDFPVESFALIVLMHELIHGYSHIGFDKDGNTWETDAFFSANKVITEGFAEYYSELLLNDYFEFALEPFFCLQEGAGLEYKGYKSWFQKDETDKYEKVRRLLLACRTKKIKDYMIFKKELRKIK